MAMMKITIDDHYLAVHAQDDNSEHADNDDDMKNDAEQKNSNRANLVNAHQKNSLQPESQCVDHLFRFLAPVAAFWHSAEIQENI